VQMAEPPEFKCRRPSTANIPTPPRIGAGNGSFRRRIGG
jgi:hypothetical protein